MCLEDVRIGRAAAFSETNIAVGVSSVPAVAASPNRFCLILGPPLSGTVTFTTNGTAVSGTGLNLSAGNPPIVLTVELHGQLCTAAWNCICSVAAQNVTALQSIYLGQ